MAATTQKQDKLSTAAAAQNAPLAQAVYDVLLRYDPIRSSDSPIHVVTADGVVTLSGLVRTRTMKSMAEALTRRVPGVRDVQNELLTDTDIELAIALELGTNERLRRAGSNILVRSLLGTVYLSGDVEAPSLEEAQELKELAEEIAEGVPGVIRAVNAIVARERGHVAEAETTEAVEAGPSAEVAGKLAELRERRSNWAERATTG